MPPTKKRRLVNPEAAPGIGKRLLLETFPLLLSTTDLKIGHILHVYVTSGNSSLVDRETLKDPVTSPTGDFAECQYQKTCKEICKIQKTW